MPFPEATLGSDTPLPGRVADSLDAACSLALLRKRLFGYERGSVRIAKYRVIRLLGAGATGRVYLAFDPQLEREVALKLLHPDLLREAGADRQQQRLLREARAIAKFKHPNTIEVYEVGESDGRVFVAMEYVRGTTLRQWASGRRWEAILDVCVQAGRGLSAAHDAGLVHRDFKPDNVLVGEDGVARVVDFGLARSGGDEAERVVPRTEPQTGLDDDLTRTGEVVGTPAYMAPERYRSEPAGARSDQFSYCVTTWEAVLGIRPFAGSTVAQLYEAAQDGSIATPVARAAPRWIARILRRGLDPDPQRRFESMGVLLDAIERRRRRAAWRRRLEVGTAGAFVLMPVVSQPAAAVADPCPRVSTTLDGAWGPEARAALTEALTGVDRPYAARTAQQVDSALDAYVRRWIDAEHEACEATRAAGESSASIHRARMQCLGQRLDGFNALRRLLTLEADPAILERAVQATLVLPEPLECHDALVADASEDAGHLRTELAEAEAQLAAGRFAQSLDIAQRVADEAESLGAHRMQALALHAAGFATEKVGSAQRAEELMRRAADAAAKAGDDKLVARAWIYLAHVVAQSQSQPERGAEMVRFAETAVSRTGEDGSVRVDLLLAQANIGQMQGDLESARARLTEAVGIAGELYGPDDLRTINVIAARGRVHGSAGRHDEARVDLTRVLDAYREGLGAEHPRVAHAHVNLGVALEAAGELAAVVEHYEAAREIFEHSLGREHPHVAMTLNNIGNMRRRLSQPAEALAPLRRALAIFEATRGPDHPHVAFPLNSLGLAHLSLGRPELAEPVLARALTIRARHLGADAPLVGDVHHGLAGALLALGRDEAALEHAEAAWRIRRDAGVGESLKAEAQFTLAKALWRAPGRRGKAVALAREARGWFAGAGGGFSAKGREVEGWLAERERLE